MNLTVIVVSMPRPAGWFQLLDAVGAKRIRQSLFAADMTRRINPHRNEFRRHEFHDGRDDFIIERILRQPCGK